MGMSRETMNTIESCDMNDKDVQISKWKKLNGRRYKEWVKSRMKAKGSETSVQKRRLLIMSDSSDNEAANTDSSPSLSEPERLCFQLRRVRPSGPDNISSSPDLADQTEVQKIENNIPENLGNVDESKLHEEFVPPSAEENKCTTTDFVEYWVPVRLSNIQTEQYCGALFSNSTSLCSSYSLDPMKSLHEILFSTKLCCDHPYLVDWSLHTTLSEGIPQSDQLDAQIKLSSKLFLLHKALWEINKRGLRVLVLYQSLGGSGQITTGDILDDIIHENFGEDSFVRIDGNISKSKRRRVLNSFNRKDGGKFVCLMETRSCIPSIKLKSMDTVIFFNSDWDPMNDLKALQKLNLDSQFETVKVFRLYSAYTVEEKVLMLAKQGKAPEGNIRNIKRSTCQDLLTWGAYFLFHKLEDFHAVSTADTGSVDSHVNTFVEDVFHEMSMLLPNNGDGNVDTKSSLILEVQQIGGVYPSNISLVGEVEYPLMDNFSVISEMLINEPPYIFWTNMLQGRTPSWKYFSCQSPRTRKSVQRLDDLPEERIGPSKRFRTEAGSNAGETPNITRRKRRRRRTPGEAAAQTQMLDKPSSMELHSQSPPDDHDQLPSRGHSAGDSPFQATRRASDKTHDAGAREASQAPHVKALESACKALQTELDRLENQKTESSKQHKDKKVKTRMECEEEVGKIRKKYKAIQQKDDADFLEEKQVLDARYKKVLVNKELAEALIQRDSTNASLSQVAISFSVEQARRLISQSQDSSTEMRAEEAALPSVASPAAPRLGTGCCSRAPAPHLRSTMHSPTYTLPRPSELPRMFFSPVSLVKATPLLLPSLLPP